MYILDDDNRNMNNTNNVGRDNYSQSVRETSNADRTRNGFRTKSALLRRKCSKTALVYLLVSVFCVIFCLIYERFSYGQYADCMRLMFLPPLAGGALPFEILAHSGSWRRLSRVSYNLWNSGIAVLVSGCLIKGIIEISGRASDYDMLYWIVGISMLASALLIQIFGHGENLKN